MIVASFPQRLFFSPLTSPDLWLRAGQAEEPSVRTGGLVLPFLPLLHSLISSLLARALLPRTSTRNVLQELQLSRELLGEQENRSVFLNWFVSGLKGEGAVESLGSQE